MQNDKTTAINRDACSHKEIKTASDNDDSVEKIKNDAKRFSWFYTTPAIAVFHYLTVFVLGLLTWGSLWFAFGEGWALDGQWLRLATIAATAWVSGDMLQGLTGLPPLLAALLTGIFARHFDILDMRDFSHIDMFLRKVYPVVILGKASLAWDVTFMKSNWRQVAALGVVPWTLEVLTLAICTHLLLGFPWLWGILLGSIYASVSCAVVMPSVQKLGSKAGGGRNWGQFVCTAGGMDTALSVGIYGIVYSFMFADTNDDVYRYCKAALGVLAGIGLGVTWGTLAGFVPHPRDNYCAAMRILFVLLGGLFGNYFTSHIGWGGTGGMAVLACNLTASTHWVRQGWRLNNNPASKTYRVLWAALEPALFAFTGTFFVLHAATARTMLYGVAILCACLTVRLAATFFMCWDMNIRERLFVCCTWVPKSIVEAVLGPVTIHTLVMSGHTKHQMEYAEDLFRLIVQAILITTPLGYFSAHYLGPTLLKSRENNGSQEQEKSSNV